MTTGEKIRAFRKERGLTQKQLGEKCGIAEPTIRRYELGKLNPKYETLRKICNALDIPVYRIIGIESQIDIALNTFEFPKEAAAAAHEILTSGDREAAISLTRAILNRRKETVPDDILVGAVDRIYSLSATDQLIVVEIINHLYNNAASEE